MSGTATRAELLDTSDLLLRSLQVLVRREFGAAFADTPRELGEVVHSLAFLRRSVAELAAASLPARQSPGRMAAPLVSTPGGPGSTFCTPRCVGAGCH